MMIKLCFQAFLLLFSLAIAAQKEMSQEEQNLGAAENLASLLRDMQTLSAEVNVLTLDQDGREIQESESRLIMQKPDHFSWETISPYPELMVTDGNRIWRFEYDLEQITIEPFSDDVGRTPVLLLNGNADDIAETYFVAAAATDSGSRQRFILTPRVTDSLFTRLSLTFANNLLEEMQFEDSLGQKTSLSFANLEINRDIDASVFTVELSDDMEIIDNTGEL